MNDTNELSVFGEKPTLIPERTNVRKRMTREEIQKRKDLLEIPRPPISKQQEKFLHYLSRGFSTREAHKLAGYKGSYQSAYSLRAKLRQELRDMLDADGMSKTGVLLEIKKLMDMPMSDKSISINQKIRALQLLTNTLKDEPDKDKPAITPFVIGHVETLTVTNPEPSLPKDV